MENRVKLHVRVYKKEAFWWWYWPLSLPPESQAIGVVEFGHAKCRGALIRLKSGVYVQGNHGVIRNLPQREVRLALELADR